MDVIELTLLAAACLGAGVINAMAGGGSLFTLPLLTILGGIDGLDANGTNRVGILAQNLASFGAFARAGLSGLRGAVPILIPVLAGSGVGAVLASLLEAEQFEVAFGVLMVPVLIVSLFPPKQQTTNTITWPRWATVTVFAVVGLYGGAFQAGVGLMIVLALSRAGLNLVDANAVKVVVIAALTMVAVPVFIVQGQVHWGLAVVVAAGYSVGGWLGAHIGIKGGEKVIRPVMIVAVGALAGRMLGLY